MSKNNISLENNIIEYISNSYGDNISNVINEIEKLYLITHKRKLKFSDYNSTYKNRNLKYWNLMNSLGSKKIEESLHIYKSLIINGISLVPIIINLTNFYSALLNEFSLIRASAFL